MGKTYRNIPTHELIEEEMKSKKIKKIDHKHGKAIVADGFYSHPINDGDEININNKTVRFEGVVTPKAKKLAKKMAVKRARKNKIEIED